MRSKADADDKDWERQDAFLWLRKDIADATHTRQQARRRRAAAAAAAAAASSSGSSGAAVEA